MRSLIVFLGFALVVTAAPALAGGGRSRGGVNSGYSIDGKWKSNLRKFNTRNHRHHAAYRIRRTRAGFTGTSNRP